MVFKNIDFMGLRKVAMSISLAMILVSIISLFINGLNVGIDFTGGSVIEVGYEKSVDLQPIREVLQGAGYGDAIVQHFGSAKEVLIRLVPSEGQNKADLSSQIIPLLSDFSDNKMDVRRVDFVGPQVGEELRDDGGLAVVYALIAILIYVSLRFEYRFSLGAVAALVHDVIITLGVFSIVQLDFDLSVLAAILAVIGYSLNDTIVVFDRIRENFRHIRKVEPVDVINISINQTLSRTLMTSFTTLIVLFSLYFLGGEVIQSFALALIIGIVVGTYSSVYVASASALFLGVTRSDLMAPQKEDGGESAAVDDRP
jgi:preprotein translocase subunit SecF